MTKKKKKLGRKNKNNYSILMGDLNAKAETRQRMQCRKTWNRKR